MFGVDSNLHLYHGRYMKYLLYAKCQGGCRILTARQDWLRGPNSALPRPLTDTMVSSAHQAVYPQGSVCEEEGALLIHAEHSVDQQRPCEWSYTPMSWLLSCPLHSWGACLISHVTQLVGGKAGIEPKSPVSKHLLRCPGTDRKAVWSPLSIRPPTCTCLPGRRASTWLSPPSFTYAPK